jgi:hypothetical protein
MALYRIYRVDAADHIADAENVECADDEEACAKAREMQGYYPAVEVWEGSRLVARIGIR